MKGFPDLPPLWLLAHLAAAWGLARLFPPTLSNTSLVQAGGAAAMLTGFALIAWSALWFWRKRTTIEPHHTPGTLIVEGPYKLSRNPIYLGMVMILWGYACWLASIPAMALTPILWWILTRRFAIPEEAALIAAFGPQAHAYLAATRRWV